MEETAECERISNLLIVEDDESQLRTLTAIMQEEGFHVTGCSTASEAIEHLENLEAGVVVLDLCLPDLSGTQLLERLAAATDRIRVIINTAYNSYESAKDALNLGAFAYVEKASDPKELLRHVHRAFAAIFRSYSDQLEIVVAERTRELRQANESLKNEIAHRQNTQQALERERDKAQKYLDIVAVMMVAIDSEQRVGLINKRGCEILGYAEEEILGKNWFDNFLPERVRDETRTIFEKFVKGQADAPEYVESSVLTKRGRERLIAWHNTTLRDDQGSFVATLSSGEDITERRQVQDALRQSEEKYRDLFENARQAIITFNTQGNITGANKLVEDYGFKREELIGKSFLDYISEAHRTKAVEDFETVISGRLVRGEMDVITPKGTITVEYSDNPIFREGKVAGVQAILMDVTERKKAVDALKRQTLLSQVFLDSMPCVALLLRPQTREIVAANRQAEEIGAVPGTTCYGAWAQRESACPWCLAPEVWNTGEPRHLVVEYEGIVWDAHWVPIEEDLYLHYAFDITERKKVEERLLEYHAKLKAMASEILRTEECERKRIALGLHDNICQNLVLTKVLLQSTLKLVSDPSVSGPLKMASGAMSELIEQANSLTFELRNPVLHDLGLVPALEKHLAEEIQDRRGIAFELTGDERLNIPDEELKNCLFRISRELLTNVVKHSQARTVKVSVHGSPGQIRIKVQDDGVGFDTTQAGAGTSVKNRFGLFSIREQLEHLGGNLAIESEPGRGTTATVVVPLGDDTLG